MYSIPFKCSSKISIFALEQKIDNLFRKIMQKPISFQKIVSFDLNTMYHNVGENCKNVQVLVTNETSNIKKLVQNHKLHCKTHGNLHCKFFKCTKHRNSPQNDSTL